MEAFVAEGVDLLGGEVDVDHRRRPGRSIRDAESGDELTAYVTPRQSSTLSREEYISTTLSKARPGGRRTGQGAGARSSASGRPSAGRRAGAPARRWPCAR